MRKSICRSNFDKISQATAETLLLSVSENKRTKRSIRILLRLSMKITKMLYFTYLKRNPIELISTRFEPKFALGLMFRRNHKTNVYFTSAAKGCAAVQRFKTKMFRSHDFTVGSNFRFFIDFCVGLTTR